MAATWLADVLRNAGIKVVEHDDWKTRGYGEFVDLEAVIWHHDASAPGYSPGMADYIEGQVDAHEPGANCWVTLDGTWHVIAAEVTYHAGTVLPGKPGNHRSIGVETDHTTGETWSGVVLLDSLRRGTAAILAHLHQTPATGLEFHKTICSPPRRKTDPDGLDLITERAAVAALLHPEDDEMTQDEHDAVMTANHFVKNMWPQFLEQYKKDLAELRMMVGVVKDGAPIYDIPSTPVTVRDTARKVDAIAKKIGA